MATHTFRTGFILLAGGSLMTGCAQIGSVADEVWGGTKQVASWVASPVTSLLRDAPDTEYAFEADTPEGEVEAEVDYAALDMSQTTSPYAGGTVELYAEPAFTSTPQTVSSASGYYFAEDELAGPPPVVTEPVQSISFVRLDGRSPSLVDWQNCEATSGGYWTVDANGGRMNPSFEVCMRNKAYVLETERATYGKVASATGGYAPLP